MEEEQITLKKLRKQWKLSQESLAACLNIPRSTIACWESGQRHPTRDNIQSLAKFFRKSFVEIDLMFVNGGSSES